MSFENLALRACAFTGAGTLLAMLANMTLGTRDDLLLASMLGAAIGSCIGWILVQQKLPRGTADDLVVDPAPAARRPVRR